MKINTNAPDCEFVITELSDEEKTTLEEFTQETDAFTRETWENTKIKKTDLTNFILEFGSFVRNSESLSREQQQAGQEIMNVFMENSG